jgi:hypothetical protein
MGSEVSTGFLVVAVIAALLVGAAVGIWWTGRTGRKTRAVAAAALLFGTTAEAGPVLKFDDPLAPGGTVTWTGPGAGIVGSDIQFQSILGIDTPENAGVFLDCVGCAMNFLTGPATAQPAGGGILITAATGGTLGVTGGVPARGVADGSVLVAGTFADNPDQAIGPGAEVGLFGGAGPLATFEHAIASFYGLGGQFGFATTDIQAIGAFDPATGVFTGEVVNADLNVIAPVAVRAPWTLALLAAGAMAVGVAWRRSTPPLTRRRR